MVWVYIYEPDPGVRDLLSMQVESLGHHLASGGGEFDIALIETGTLEGHALAHEVRQRHPHVPLTVVLVRSLEEKTRNIWTHAHLVKPFALRVLESAIEGTHEMFVTGEDR